MYPGIVEHKLSQNEPHSVNTWSESLKVLHLIAVVAKGPAIRVQTVSKYFLFCSVLLGIVSGTICPGCDLFIMCH